MIPIEYYGILTVIVGVLVFAVTVYMALVFGGAFTGSIEKKPKQEKTADTAE